MIDLWIVVAFFLEIFADILPSARLLYDVVWISEAVKWVAAIYMLLNTFGRNRLQIWKDRFGGNNDLCLFPCGRSDRVSL